MAAAPITSTWIPEDDLLLKNAVEAGASLEALAKGAVQFSRRFTYKELRDRWHSLLYDPDVAAQASSHMFQLELYPSSKFNIFDNSKGSKEIHGKRKFGSIRRQYYSMRKKIRSEFYNSNDLGCFAEPNVQDCGGCGGDFGEQVTLNNEPRDGDGNFVLGDYMSDHLELHETDFEILRQAFPEAMRDIAATTYINNNGNTFHTGRTDPVADNNANRTVRRDGFNGFPAEVSPPIGDTERESVEKKIGNPGTLHAVNFAKCLGTEEVGPSQELPFRKAFETDDSGMKKISTFDTMNNDHQNLCSVFGGKQHFNSPDSDGSVSFHTMGFSSPLPRLPLWKTMEDISPPAMPVNVSHDDATQGAEEESVLPNDDDGKKQSPSDFHIIHSGTLLTDRHDGAGFISSTAASEGELADISDSLLNFSNEDEILFINVDGKDTMENSFSTNLNFRQPTAPDDASHVNKAELKTLVVSSTCPIPTVARPAEPEDASSSIHDEQQSVCQEEASVPSNSVLNTNSNELNHGNIFCTLNTEDQEIPCNDDIFLLIHPATSFTSSTLHQITMDAGDPKASPVNQRNGHGIKLVNKAEDPVQCTALSNMVGVNMLPEKSSSQPLVSGLEKSDLSNSTCRHLVFRHANKSLQDPSQCRSVHGTPYAALDGVLEQDAAKVELRVVDVPSTYQEIQLQAEVDSGKMTHPESARNPTSDHEESESDKDVPYFSDIEAMILEMDLGPQDEDLCINKQVSRYQHEVSKRSIVRLEQCAGSSLQRAMSSRGALAVLYGRHMKHYITKTEVMLGRSTEEIDVDIDLAKEGRANKISRRQAIIKMERDGSFLLRNLGKSSVSVNGKTAATGQLLTLSANCLIEIRGMSFVFEINQKYVKHYLDTKAKKNRGNNCSFEWLPDGEQ